MPAEVQVPDDQLSQILGILARHAPGRSIHAFGSRAHGNPRPTSDLDLCLHGPVLELHEMAALREELEESNLPFTVDVVEWERIGARFRDLIKRDWVELRSATDAT